MKALLSSRFVDALQFALKLHGEQTRKGTDIPYVSHLLGVASIVLEHGGSEDEAIAALLHDAGEDAGGQATIDDIRHRFGDTVADLVLGCTDTLEEPKPDWRIRKEAYIAHLAEADRSMCLVSAADKLHNARSIEHDYRMLGESLWIRFRGGKDGTLWYYRTLTEAFQSKELGSLVDDLNAVVTRIEQMSQKP